MQSTLLLVTASPQSRLAYHALRLAQTMQAKHIPFQVFFYQNAVTVANADVWHAEDEINLTAAWQALNIALPVCVSAALSRGVSDDENARRHALKQHNLAAGFTLTGLAALAEAIHSAKHIIQF